MWFVRSLSTMCRESPLIEAINLDLFREISPAGKREEMKMNIRDLKRFRMDTDNFRRRVGRTNTALVADQLDLRDAKRLAKAWREAGYYPHIILPMYTHMEELKNKWCGWCVGVSGLCDRELLLLAQRRKERPEGWPTNMWLLPHETHDGTDAGSFLQRHRVRTRAWQW